MKTTLVAVSGMSPAIITETLWALAHEATPIIPDEVIVITTSRGEKDIQSQLLAPLPSWKNRSVWETLRRDLLKHHKLPLKSSKLQLTISVITLPDQASGIRQPATDIRTRDENVQAADFITQTIAPYADAQDQRLIASIAGGRKSMGALLYAAMSLLARETDRCTHVLVSEPYDTVRGFYYPGQSASIPLTDFRSEPLKHHPADARIELADIPFVPLRNKFSELNERRTFAGLVETYSKAERSGPAKPPRVILDEQTGIFTVNERPIRVVGRELLVVAFLLRRARRKQPHLANKDDQPESLQAFNSEWKAEFPFHKATSRLSGNAIQPDDFPKALNTLRDKLKKMGLERSIAFLAPKDSRIGFDIED